MAKGKLKSGIPNKHLHSRVSFLQQAATYLSSQGQNSGGAEASERYTNDDLDTSKVADAHGTLATNSMNNIENAKAETSPISVFTQGSAGGLPYYLSSHLTQVARKAPMRLHTDIKHCICKRCCNILVEGETCRKFVENLSKAGRKSHADVLVVECGACKAQKRYPVGMKRQKKKGKREAEKEGGDENEAVHTDSK